GHPGRHGAVRRISRPADATSPVGRLEGGGDFMILDFDSHDAPPDPKVKAALEWLLPVTGPDEFRARVLSEASDLQVRPISTLDRWARPALAAAATIALAAWL